MLRFYPGLTWRDLQNLPAPDFEELWQAITVLEAQETLLQFRISIYPKLKAKAQKEEHRRVHKEAYPTKMYPPKTVPVSDVMTQLNRG